MDRDTYKDEYAAMEAQAEISRLQAEVDRLRGVVHNRTIEADDADYRAHTAWNDAIEAALSELHWLCTGDKDAIRALRKGQP